MHVPGSLTYSATPSVLRVATGREAFETYQHRSRLMAQHKQTKKTYADAEQQLVQLEAAMMVR